MAVGISAAPKKDLALAAGGMGGLTGGSVDPPPSVLPVSGPVVWPEPESIGHSLGRLASS
jgi:hypothetical protein